jgi:hypothetical protein
LAIASTFPTVMPVRSRLARAFAHLLIFISALWRWWKRCTNLVLGPQLLGEHGRHVQENQWQAKPQGKIMFDLFHL